MSHLTDEQFEAILAGATREPAHLAECPACRDRLAQDRAVRARLRSAFASVHVGEDLADLLRRAAGSPAAGSAGRPASRSKILRMLRHRWPGIAAAAATLVLVIGLGFYLAKPSAATAAQAELVGIHQSNLSDGEEFCAEADPQRLAAYLKERLGFTPATPRLGQGMAIRGCCVRHFRGKIVGSYVVATPRGFISVIVVPDPPAALGMTRESPHQEDLFWVACFARNNMVAVRMGEYTYCAVGEVPHTMLTDLLRNLIAEP